MSRILRSAAMIISICAAVAGAVKEAWAASAMGSASLDIDPRHITCVVLARNGSKNTHSFPRGISSACDRIGTSISRAQFRGSAGWRLLRLTKTMRSLSLDNFKLLWADIEDGGANNRPNQRKGKRPKADITASHTG